MDQTFYRPTHWRSRPAFFRRFTCLRLTRRAAFRLKPVFQECLQRWQFARARRHPLFRFDARVHAARGPNCSLRRTSLSSICRLTAATLCQRCLRARRASTITPPTLDSQRPSARRRALGDSNLRRKRANRSRNHSNAIFRSWTYSRIADRLKFYRPTPNYRHHRAKTSRRNNTLTATSRLLCPPLLISNAFKLQQRTHKILIKMLIKLDTTRKVYVWFMLLPLLKIDCEFVKLYFYSV